MRKKNYFKFAISLFIAMPLVCSCSDNTNSSDDIDDKPTGEVLPTTDQLTVKLDLPTAVIGTDFKEAGLSLVNRLTNKVSIDQSLVQVVILDNSKASTISGEEFDKVKKVYDNDGIIVICEPSSATIERLINLGVGDSFLTYTSDEDDADAHSDDIYAFNKDGDELHLNDIYGTSSGMTQKEDPDPESGDSTITQSEVTLKHDEQTPYSFGLIADDVATWITERSLPDASEGTDLTSLIKAQKKTFMYSPGFNNKERGKGRSAKYQITYSIYAVYSFDEDKDYYFLHEEIIGNNKPMMLPGHWFEWRTSGVDFDCYGFYLKEIESENYILKPNGEKMFDGVTVHDPSPTTSEGSSTTTSGYSVNFSGNIGFTPAGGSSSGSLGGSISESFTTSIPDVAITCNVLELPGLAKWVYTVASAPIQARDGINAKIYDSPLVSRNTIVAHNCWYWTVDNPKQYSNSKPLKVQAFNNITFEYCGVRNNSFTYDWFRERCETYNYGDFTIKAPIRKKID